MFHKYELIRVSDNLPAIKMFNITQICSKSAVLKPVCKELKIIDLASVLAHYFSSNNNLVITFRYQKYPHFFTFLLYLRVFLS